ncbi:unnamed protein product [Lampetra fluviatilis]
MEHEDRLPAEQGKSPDLAPPSPLERERRSWNTYIDDLLATVAGLAAALKRKKDIRVPGQGQDVSAAIGSRARENRGVERASRHHFDGRAHSTPSKDKSTLPQALAQMAPPSDKCQKFATRSHSALMTLAKSVYPGMDHVGRDSLVLERMLLLAQEFKVVCQPRKRTTCLHSKLHGASRHISTSSNVRPWPRAVDLPRALCSESPDLSEAQRLE